MSVSSTYLAQTDSGTRASNTELVYDPTTGTWVATASTNEDGQSVNTTLQTSDNVGGSNTQVSSQTEAEKEYIEMEFNTLTGDMTLTSTKRSIRIKVNDTIQVEGLGSHLSGLYFVSAIRRTLNKDNGYTHSLTLIKNGFGDSLKKSQEVIETREDEVKKTTDTKVNVGDSVKIVGDSAVYSNAHDGVKVPAWVKQNTLTIDGVSEDGTRVRLQPINSWTYLKYIQKV